MSGIRDFYNAIKTLQEDVIESQEKTLEQVANEMAETIIADGGIFLFGTGHSAMLPQEGQIRAGGLAPVIPILRTNLMLHENALLSSAIERTQGLAPFLLEYYDPQPSDMIFIVSNSGVNSLPVEMAIRANEMGLTTIAICSQKYARIAPLSPIGKRLYEIATYVLDNGGEPGDAILPLSSGPWKVSSTSTIINSLLWQSLVAETVYILEERGAEIPIYASYNMPGAERHNQKLLSKWRKRNPHA